MRRAQVIWSVFVIAVTAAIVVLVWFNLTTYLSSDRLVVASRDEQRRLFELAIGIQDIESSARGYLLTAQPQFQTKYRNALGLLDDRISAAVKASPAIDMQQKLQGIHAAIDGRRKMLEELVTLAAAGQRDQAAELLQSKTAMENADQIRSYMLELLGEADDRLQGRLSVCRQSMLNMTRGVLVGVAALVLSSITLVLFMWRENQQQRRATAELAEARDAAMAGVRTRDEFLNVLSHELRTPLTPALMYISSMEASAHADPQRREDIKMVRRQLELEARLIDDLLDVSRIFRNELVLKLGEVSVHDLLSHVVDEFKEQLSEHKLTISCHLDASTDRVRADESRLHQAFWHLISNAIKFTPPGGSVKVQTTNSGDTITIAISDTGVGLSADQMPTLFDAFWQGDSSRTRRFGGLGVGLAIVKSIIKLHGGNIGAQSGGKDSGATFTISLPLTAIQ